MTRRYGQHFLTDENIVRRTVKASGVSKDDAVLEIGPGRGILTKELASAAKKVLAFEIDRHLFSELQSAELPDNVEVRLGDILETDLAETKKELGEYHVVANIPYEITSEVLRKFLQSEYAPKTMTVMLQKEVGERIIAKNGKTSRLSLFCGYYSVPELLFCVPRAVFDPPPKVDSCVLRFKIKKERPLNKVAEQRFFALTQAAFSQKRKKIGNTLKKILGSETEKLLASAGMDPNSRPEVVSYQNWVSLASKS